MPSQQHSFFIAMINSSPMCQYNPPVSFPCFNFLKLIFCSSILFLFTVISHIETRQILTSNAFKGGFDIDGRELFICRSHKYGQIIPGKYSKSIGKCSVTHNRREAQFNRYEILVHSPDTNYEWVSLKKPVHKLPDNVLFGGSQLGAPPTKRTLSFNVSALIDEKGELNRHSVDLIVSSDRVWGSRKRRVRRSSPTIRNEHSDWSPNWRGQMYEGVELIRSFTGKPATPTSNFTEVAIEKRNCTNGNLLLGSQTECSQDPRKSNFYIAKCALRTGNITSEQIGKVWFKESIQEWIASFPFGGHEIYCLDYSVLTLKS